MKSGEMIITNDRYAMTEAENNSMYAVQMVLVIRKLHKADMGGYKCISKNSIGDAEGTIRLYGEFIDDAFSLIGCLPFHSKRSRSFKYKQSFNTNRWQYSGVV